ncbi:DUF397 domain-containing protein [Actinacidiphila sp. ITFR-21]|uniref:DUF397 domain-containing protein n=1 Tax=Actinacidiphila sp. ITFR-21 TaxID=3075199 RepID=UPI00288C3959|nr:DUF397 domain-containing protein [Streptomyces sp. ITFR-21]WNI14193.1 DUF397 domain-containing protein [Streptomyces sp. ITFR-21]
MTTRARYPSSAAALSGLAWRRSSHSTAANNCVETARLAAGELAVRDSKDPLGPALLFPPGAWTDFVRALTGDGLGPV